MTGWLRQREWISLTEKKPSAKQPEKQTTSMTAAMAIKTLVVVVETGMVFTTSNSNMATATNVAATTRLCVNPRHSYVGTDVFAPSSQAPTAVVLVQALGS